MKKKLNCILLVDDDNDCNYFHKKILHEMNCTASIKVANDGLQAIDYLKTCNEENNPIPDIIFLDINMPRMNGWDFLEVYEKLPPDFREAIVLIMLTTSLNPDDREKASKSPFIKGFKEKYLDEETVSGILKEYFPDHF
jgi:CheY-like chemotaxis protein